MKRRNFLALVGSTSVAGSLAISSGAFSESAVDRSTEVAVVGDDEAYLTLDFPQNRQSFGCRTDLSVTIRNRTPKALDALNVRFSTGTGSIDSLSATGPGSSDFDAGAGTVSLESGSLPPGQSVEIDATVAGFSGTGTTDFNFGVTASGPSIAVTTTSDRTVELEYNCPTAPGQSLAACPLSPSVQQPEISVPQSPCDPLAFSQGALPDKNSIHLSQSPGDIREDLSEESGIEIESKIENTVTGDDRDDPLRVLSNHLSSSRIGEMPDSPSSQTFKLGGSNPQARVGTTGDGDVAAIPGNVTLKNFSTIVGELEVDGSFKIKGGSAVAGDVITETVETIKNALLLGRLETTNGGNSLSITSEAVVCGSVDAAGSIGQVKQSRIAGNLKANGDIGEINEATVAGDVTTTPGSNGDIIIKQNSLIDGDVDAAGNIGEVGSSEVTGRLEADGDVSAVKQSTIGGTVVTTEGSTGDITVEESTIGGSISADGNIPALKSVSEVGGPVEADGTISSVKTSTVDGSVTAPEISQLEGVRINGSVTATAGANKDITVKDNNDRSVICGNVVSKNGRVEKIKNSKVNGSVEAAQVGTLEGSSTEVGQGVETTDQSADLKINSATVYGVVDAAGPIPEIKQARVEGSVTAGGEVNLNESVVCAATGASLTTKRGGSVKVKSVSKVDGSIDAAGPIEAIKGDSTVEGDVESGDEVAEINTATIDGDVTADGRIGEIKQSRVRGAVTAGGNVKINDSETGPVETNSDGDLTVEGSSTVGPIALDGAVTKIKESEVEGNVEATDVKKIKDSTVTGDVIATGDVLLKGSTTVEGDVDAGGTVEVLENATVEGEIK